MNELLAVLVASRRVIKALKSGQNPDENSIRCLVEAVDKCEFDEIVVDTNTVEVV